MAVYVLYCPGEDMVLELNGLTSDHLSPGVCEFWPGYWFLDDETPDYILHTGFDWLRRTRGTYYQPPGYPRR